MMAFAELCCDRGEIKSGPFQLSSAGCLGGPNSLKLHILSARRFELRTAPIEGKFLGHDSGLAIPTLLYAHARLAWTQAEDHYDIVHLLFVLASGRELLGEATGFLP